MQGVGEQDHEVGAVAEDGKIGWRDVQNDVAEERSDGSEGHGEHDEKRLVKGAEGDGQQGVERQKQGDATDDRAFPGFLVLGHIAGVTP